MVEQVAELCELTADELIARAERLLALARELKGEAAQLSGRRLPELSVKRIEKPQEPEESKQRRLPSDTGRFGTVTKEIALIKAQRLGEFNQTEFAAALGLRAPAHQRWLSMLVEEGALEYGRAKYRCKIPIGPRDWVVEQEEPFSVADLAKACQVSELEALTEITKLLDRGIVARVGDGGMFRYVPPPAEGPREHPTGLPPEKERPSYELAPVRGEPVRKSASDRSSRKQRSTPGQGHQLRQRDKRYEEMQAKQRERAEANKARSENKAKKKGNWQSRSNKRAA